MIITTRITEAENVIKMTNENNEKILETAVSRQAMPNVDEKLNFAKKNLREKNIKIIFPEFYEYFTERF